MLRSNPQSRRLDVAVTVLEWDVLGGTPPGRSSVHEPPPRDPSDLERTVDLLTRVRSGDDTARERLLERFLPVMTRWAHGRLPTGSRTLLETQDLVQDVLARALLRLDDFRSTREGAFFAYLRSIVLNSIRDELRKLARRPGPTELPDRLTAGGPSPLEDLMGRDRMETYEAALASLPDVHREAIILRFEFDLPYEEIAEATGKPSANAARMMVSRAVVRLAEVFDDPR